MSTMKEVLALSPMLYSSVGMTIPWLIRTSDDVGKGCAEED
jgi:hypothetical protein